MADKVYMKIPEPTDEDLAWAQQPIPTSDENFIKGALDSKSLWRTYYYAVNTPNINAIDAFALRHAAFNQYENKMAILLDNGACPTRALAEMKTDKGRDHLERFLSDLKGKTYNIIEPSPWFVVSPEKIQKTEYEKSASGPRRITQVFNFESQKITTTIEKGNKMAMAIEKFSDQDFHDEIIEAHTLLSSQHPNLPDISNYIPKTLKTAQKSQPL